MLWPMFQNDWMQVPWNTQYLPKFKLSFIEWNSVECSSTKWSTKVHRLNSIESKKSEALINNEISHEGFLTIINEEKNIEN